MENDRLVALITVRLTIRERQLLERMATLEKRKMSDMARLAIIEAAARRGLAAEDDVKQEAA
jgi:hypothetical protein